MLVYLNMFPRLDTILIGPHHASAELVENAEGRLIARQAKLSSPHFKHLPLIVPTYLILRGCTRMLTVAAGGRRRALGSRECLAIVHTALAFKFCL